MPKRNDIKNILIIGAGPIVIGQACEFDYAGTQACKALKEEGYRVILVNSNPATIMTDSDIADVTYIEPITVEFLERIIEKEKPDALLPTLGGQTALNCALALEKKGILKKYHVELIGASVKAIELAENRSQFQNLMKSIGLSVPHSMKIKKITEAKTILKKINLPVVIRSSFTLGGTGAGIANTEEEFIQLCEQAFHASPFQEVMIDEALIGWKEFELEIIRDKKNNCIVVCGVENIDPLGIHTGDSITVAPIQTLTDKEYQHMRQAAFSVLRAVGVDTGGSNVQFAIHPHTGKMVVIEMNPRVSRSSALVSKASGFPIAKIAAKLAVGYTLDELKNDITGEQLPASFEPSLDYVVVKIPRFNFEKFSENNFNRGPQMRSVGEVMAIGRTFSESLQKAMRSLEMNQEGFSDEYAKINLVSLKEHLKTSGHMQLWAIGEAFRRKITINEIAELTKIDLWFLNEIHSIIQTEMEIISLTIENLTPALLKKYKKSGFSDSRIAHLLNCTEKEIYQLRGKNKIHPVYKRIDSCAGEFVTPTAYMYGTYEQTCEAMPTSAPKILVIGSGPNRIGQGIEFDYCCVHAVKALKKAGYETIMVNCNPETVSTDYDVVDRLYCIPLTLEDILAVIENEKPIGVLVQYGGQTPLQLAKGLALSGVPLLGLDSEIIQATEDRDHFKKLIQNLKLNQPKNKSVYTLEEGMSAAKQIGFPLIVRPSFVLGGSSMAIITDEKQLQKCLTQIFSSHSHYAVLIEEFLTNAIEIDVDAISDGETIFIPALLEQIEPAGIHSGDSACFTPPMNISDEIKLAIMQQTQKMASHLKLKGALNIQFAVKENKIYIIEVNPRASRTLPFLCKVTGLPLVQIATHCVLGKTLVELGITKMPELPFYYVKEAVLPFAKFPNASAMLGPEMKSTGEVMGMGKTIQEAYAKAQIAAGNVLPHSGNIYLISTASCANLLKQISEKLNQLGFHLFTSEIPEQCDLIIALHESTETDVSVMKGIRYAINKGISYVTSFNAAAAIVSAIEYQKKNNFHLISLQENIRLVQSIQKPKHILTGEELTKKEIESLLSDAIFLKSKRAKKEISNELNGHHLALLFDKPSLRTRFSFSVAVRELGGDVIESVESTRKTETPEDQAGVLSGYCHAIVVRTHEDSILEKMCKTSKVPIINGLSALHHPCQILADLLTLHEKFGSLQGLTLSYIGDGNNILHSLLLLAPQMGIHLHYCCPETRGPDENILEKSIEKSHAHSGKIKSFSSPDAAVAHAHAVYTDVWTSMGFENENNHFLFDGFQVNEALMKYALPEAIFMHCLPMVRGTEVSHTLPDQPCSVIYQQSENRLHIQKALLLHLLKNEEINYV